MSMSQSREAARVLDLWAPLAPCQAWRQSLHTLRSLQGELDLIPPPCPSLLTKTPNKFRRWRSILCAADVVPETATPLTRSGQARCASRRLRALSGLQQALSASRNSGHSRIKSVRASLEPTSYKSDTGVAYLQNPNFSNLAITEVNLHVGRPLCPLQLTDWAA
jgi:hypothetical protein